MKMKQEVVLMVEKLSDDDQKERNRRNTLEFQREVEFRIYTLELNSRE